MKTKTQISERDGGYVQFKQRSPYTGLYEKWKEVELKVRRVRQDDRDETQIEICIEQAIEKKALRVYSQLFSLSLSPKDARTLAFAICPELAEIIEEAKAQALEGGTEFQGDVLETVAGLRESLPTVNVHGL